MDRILVCTPKTLSPEQRLAAAKDAMELNPANYPHAAMLGRALAGIKLKPERIALLVANRWPSSGVRLTVQFLDNPPTDLRKRILVHMNAWAKTANVLFTETRDSGDVRIARFDSPPEISGYWSYVGIEIRQIPRDQPTMNLEGFTMHTSESEFHRVVRHETGHTLGFPHEHMRRELVKRIDAKKATEYFGRTQGWTPEEVQEQVLTPIEESSLIGTPYADQYSIMCYQIPGFLTIDGKPIIGGTDIDKSDYAFAASIYPKHLSVHPNAAATV